ncbi:MAG TPA: DUF2127 domain-containing protein [Candidatus Solibacter sp.]|nr:DUF2127 domain-containing protein [Candidatus Solibacter sp.]
MAEPAEPVAASRSWWGRLREDLGRRIEQRGFVIWYLIVERGLRGVAVFVLGFYLFTVHAGQIPSAVDAFEAQFGLTEGGGGWIDQLVHDLLGWIEGLSANGVTLIAIGSVLYGMLEMFEAAGLILRRRWAEYVVVIATGFGIPIEIREVLMRLTWLRLALLVINIAIVIYLVARKRLFIFDEGANA